MNTLKLDLYLSESVAQHMVADKKESVAHAAAFMLQRTISSAQQLSDTRRTDVGGQRHR